MRSLTTSTLSEVGVVMIEEYVVCGVNCMYVCTVCKNKLKSIIIQYSSTKYKLCIPEFSESDAQIQRGSARPFSNLFLFF